MFRPISETQHMCKLCHLELWLLLHCLLANELHEWMCPVISKVAVTKQTAYLIAAV